MPLGQHYRELLTAIGALMFLFLIATGRAWAAGPSVEVHDKFRSGTSVTIGTTEIIPHDLYVTGSVVQIDGRIDGDLFVAASTVNITGAVTGNLYVAGGTLLLSGPVNGDVFAAGGNVTISGPVKRHLRVAGGTVSVGGPVQLDLLAGAGTLSLHPEAHVGGDVVFQAAQVALDSQVDGGVLGSASQYAKTGVIAGTEDVQLTPRANPAAEAPRRDAWLREQAQRYLGILLVGCLLIAVLPRRLLAATAGLRARPIASAGIGALGLTAFIPIVIAGAIVVVLISIPFGLLGMGRLIATLAFGGLTGAAILSFILAVVWLFGAAIVVGLTVGQIALERTELHMRAERYVALALGTLLIVTLTALPVLGWIVQFSVVCTGLGALLMTRRPRARGAAAMGGTASTITQVTSWDSPREQVGL